MIFPNFIRGKAWFYADGRLEPLELPTNTADRGDCWLDEANPDTTRSGEGFLRNYNNVGARKISIMKGILPEIPVGMKDAQIVVVEMWFKINMNPTSIDRFAPVYLIQDWLESVVTWNRKDSHQSWFADPLAPDENEKMWNDAFIGGGPRIDYIAQGYVGYNLFPGTYDYYNGEGLAFGEPYKVAFYPHVVGGLELVLYSRESIVQAGPAQTWLWFNAQSYGYAPYFAPIMEVTYICSPPTIPAVLSIGPSNSPLDVSTARNILITFKESEDAYEPIYPDGTYQEGMYVLMKRVGAGAWAVEKRFHPGEELSYVDAEDVSDDSNVVQYRLFVCNDTNYINMAGATVGSPLASNIVSYKRGTVLALTYTTPDPLGQVNVGDLIDMVANSGVYGQVNGEIDPITSVFIDFGDGIVGIRDFAHFNFVYSVCGPHVLKCFGISEAGFATKIVNTSFTVFNKVPVSIATVMPLKAPTNSYVTFNAADSYPIEPGDYINLYRFSWGPLGGPYTNLDSTAPVIRVLFTSAGAKEMKLQVRENRDALLSTLITKQFDVSDYVIGPNGEVVGTPVDITSLESVKISDVRESLKHSTESITNDEGSFILLDKGKEMTDMSFTVYVGGLTMHDILSELRRVVSDFVYVSITWRENDVTMIAKGFVTSANIGRVARGVAQIDCSMSALTVEEVP